MRLISKVLFGTVALVTATAATFPRGFGDMYVDSTYPQDIRKREALKLCQEENLSFVTFLASDRDECYRQMRSVGLAATYSGVWSKPDRKHMQVSSAN